MRAMTAGHTRPLLASPNLSATTRTCHECWATHRPCTHAANARPHLQSCLLATREYHERRVTLAVCACTPSPASLALSTIAHVCHECLAALAICTCTPRTLGHTGRLARAMASLPHTQCHRLLVAHACRAMTAWPHSPSAHACHL